MNINTNKPPEGQAPPRPDRNAQVARKPDAVEQKDSAAPAKSTAPADRVELSGRSKEIADLMSSVDQLPEVRESKVREIQERVDSGTYTVDANKVAEKILRSI